MFSPLEQFEIFYLFAAWKYFFLTNFFLTAFFITAAICLTFYFTVRINRMSLSRWQGFLEIYYNYVLGILLENAGKRSQPYFPFLFTVFTFILTANFFGMFPFGYAITSQVLVTFTLSCTVFLASILIGLWKHRINFFSLFFPAGSPPSLAPLLVPIEVLSFVSRPFSLGIRLFANMLAGHVLLKIMAGFIFVGFFFASIGIFTNLEYIIKQTYSLGMIPFGKTDPISLKVNAIALYNEHYGFYFSKKFLQILWNEEVNKAIIKYLRDKDRFYALRDLLIKHVPQLADFLRDLEYPPFDWVAFEEKWKKKVKFLIMRPIGGEELSFNIFNLTFFSQIVDYFIKIILIVLPLCLLNAFIFLELGIAFLQAYVFIILSTIYINDGLNLH